MVELTAATNQRTGAVPGTAPRVDSRQISWWAESADGTRDKELALVLTADGEYLVKEAAPGDHVVLRMFTPSDVPTRRRPVEITFQAPGCERIRLDEVADALFWTESAVDKFLYPYYASQRLLTDEEMARLKVSFRDERAVAIWHQAPSRSWILYGRPRAVEDRSVAADPGDRPEPSWTLTPSSGGPTAPRVDSRQISWWAESADGTRDKELALVLTASGEYVVKEEELGDDVVLRMYTPSTIPDRMKPVEITFQAPGCEKVRIEEVADAIFWTESAVDKFLFPYYASQRLFTDEEMRRLKESFRDERVVAIWHFTPSRPYLQYASDGSLDMWNVVLAEPQPVGKVATRFRGLREFLGAAGVDR